MSERPPSVSYRCSWLLPAWGVCFALIGCSAGDTPEVLVERGNLLRDEGRLDEAETAYRTAIEGFLGYLEDEPENGYVWYELANVYSELGDHEHAVEGYTKAMEFSAEYAESAFAWYQLATSHFNLGQNDEAREAYDTAIRLDPNEALAFNDRGWLMQTAFDDKEAALRDYTEAMRLNPGDQIAIVNRAMLHKEASEWELALADMNRALEINDEHPGNYFERAEIQYQLGQMAAAIADFTQAITLDPEFIDAYVSRGLVRRELGLADEAEADFDKARGLSPGLTIPAGQGRGEAAPEGLVLADAAAIASLELQGYSNLEVTGEGTLRIHGVRDGEQALIFIVARNPDGGIHITDSDVVAIRESASPVDLVIITRSDAEASPNIEKVVRGWSPADEDLRPVQYELTVP